MKKIFTIVLFFIADIGIYIFLGLLLMEYDDFYDESKGEYWSLASMNSYEKAIYFSFITWNIINWIIGSLVIFKITKFFLSKLKTKKDSCFRRK